MRFLLLFFFTVIPSFAYPASCLDITMDLPVPVVVKISPGQCSIKSFPEEDFYISIRKIRALWKYPENLKNNFFARNQTVNEATLTLDQKDYLVWSKKETLNKNEVTTKIYFFHVKDHVYSLWVSYRTEQAGNFFSDVFFQLARQ